MKKILVLGRKSYVDPENVSRSLYERVLEPLKTLSGDYNFEVCPESSADNITPSSYDLLYLSRHKSKECLNLVNKFRKSNKKIVYDLDDWVFDFPPNSIANWNSEAMSSCREILFSSDIVISASKRLHSNMSQLKLKSAFIPTGIEVSCLKLQAFKERRCIFINGDNVKVYNFREDFFRLLNSDLPPLNISLDLVADDDSAFKERFPYNLFTSIPRESLNSFLTKGAYSFSINPVASDEDPSYLEFMECKSPIKYLIYGAHGIPGIYSDISIYSDVVSDGHTGFVVKNDYKSWLGAVEKMSDLSTAKKLGENAFFDVKENHSLELMASRIKAVLESL